MKLSCLPVSLYEDIFNGSKVIDLKVQTIIKNVKKELKDAYLNWNFQYKLHNSISDKRGSVLIVSGLKKNND